MDLQLSPKDMPSISGNFDTYKADLIKQIEGYKASPLTEETIAPVKSAIRSIRTTLEKIESTAVSAYFDSPKKALKAQFAELYSIIAEGENKVDAIIAEDTRKRNEEVTVRLTGYIKSKVKEMALEKDAADFVVLKKAYFNKTAKETDTLNEIDADLLQLEKNFASYIRAEKKINKLAVEAGPALNKSRYIYALSKYGEGNDEVAAQAEEEADRLKAIPAEETVPTKSLKDVPMTVQPKDDRILQHLSVAFPAYSKKTSKGSDEIFLSFTVPKEFKSVFAGLLKELKVIGITSKKVQ